MRDFRKLKTLQDYRTPSLPQHIELDSPDWWNEHGTQRVLRMLVRPKYGNFMIPQSLEWLRESIEKLSVIDAQQTGINTSWCYVTVRRGPVVDRTDAEWHYDGASFRTNLIPERNYVWVSHTGTEYKSGCVKFPTDFDPTKHDLFSFADWYLRDVEIKTTQPRQWYRIDPFLLHRRPPQTNNDMRTFIRIAFPDVEGRDVNNTPNPLLSTPAFGRDPVKNFRDALGRYQEDA